MASQGTQGTHERMRQHAGGYLPIENYGLIGNMRTCALVGMDGSVEEGLDKDGVPTMRVSATECFFKNNDISSYVGASEGYGRT